MSLMKLCPACKELPDDLLIEVRSAINKLLETRSQEIMKECIDVQNSDKTDKFLKFGKLMYGWATCQEFLFDLEISEEIMEMATEAGLAERVKYDPEKHGEINDADPGDEIWHWVKLEGE